MGLHYGSVAGYGVFCTLSPIDPSTIQYSSPTARIRVNRRLSDAFAVSNGRRQGCPLSPLIFVLTLEPLLHKLRTNSNVKGIDIRNKHYKVAVYADDILLFLSDPLITIPNLLQDFTLFQKLSNLQINFAKSTNTEQTLRAHQFFQNIALISFATLSS